MRVPSGLEARPHTRSVWPVRLNHSRPPWGDTSHNFTVLSRLAVAKSLPSGLKATPITPLVWPDTVSNSRPVAASQIFAVPSSLAVASSLPLESKAISVTKLAWANTVRRLWPVAASHTIQVVLKLPVARRLPSGLKAMLLTRSAWGRLSNSWPEARSQTLAILSLLAVARRVPSGLKARVPTFVLPLLTSWLGPVSVNNSRPAVASHSFASPLALAVLDGSADLAVHSAKDLPALQTPGLVLAAVPERADPRDVLVAREPVSGL